MIDILAQKIQFLEEEKMKQNKKTKPTTTTTITYEKFGTFEKLTNTKWSNDET